MRRGRISIGDGMFGVLLVAVDLAVLRALVFRSPQDGSDPIEFAAGLLPLANLAAVLVYDRLRNGPGRLRRLARPLAVVAGCLYAPFVLVFLGHWPDSKEFLPIYLWALPTLPGLLIQHWLWNLTFRQGWAPHMPVWSGLVTTLLLIGLTRLGSRGGGGWRRQGPWRPSWRRPRRFSSTRCSVPDP